MACFHGLQEAAMLRLDISEYMEQHTVSKLTGSPPVYVGHEEGASLTEAIRTQPFTVSLWFGLMNRWTFEHNQLTDSQLDEQLDFFSSCHTIDDLSICLRLQGRQVTRIFVQQLCVVFVLHLSSPDPKISIMTETEKLGSCKSYTFLLCNLSTSLLD